ncbi:MAG: carbohydrate ABC transporter permease [Lachnospiraceae bacterium]|nr:carbohydrate ABC transporter permease [Lachnospiraceae bacterium]GFI23270.1 L-arabinose transport system permease protein AraQ [Lachnospiraceae bacterium]HBV84567.1 sugar ABC transporter permease [Lachnospiraceae bacterium]
MKKEKEVEVESKIKRCKEDVIFDTVIFIVLTILLLIVAYPLWWVIISSVSNSKAVSGGQVIWHPIGFTLKGYGEVFKDDSIVRSFLNSVLYTVCGVLVNLAVTLPTAYALSRDRFSGKKAITMFYVVTMFFSGGLIPTYLVVQNMHLLDTMWALILPGCLSVYNMIVARTFFKTNISEELYEAAEIDGCTQGRFFFQIALPLSGAITAIMVLYYGVGHWNSYFSGLIYLSDQNKYPLQLVLRSILITNESALQQAATTAEARAALNEKKELIEVMKYSLIIISSIPVLVLYPFIQRHFVKGVMIGSVKG